MKFKIFLISIFISCTVSGQSLRGLVNDGVEAYEKSKFSDAEVNFRKGIEKDFENFESHFNLGDALYKQQRFDDAIKSYKNAESFAVNDYQKAGIYHNIGNSLVKKKKFKESIEAYKQSLKLNPNDLETKYNLSYALKQLEKQNKNKNQQNQQDKNNKNKDNKDKNQQNKNDQNKQDQKNKDKQQDQNKQKQNQQQNKDKQDKQQQQSQPQKQDKRKMSKEEAKRILQALKNNEAELQKKLRKHKGKKVKTEKDW